eukprot:m.284531 g.284531  ORF g.284531 m.284531 type:complete len:382 (+) comp16198_c0_seq17:895-2040(+)
MSGRQPQRRTQKDAIRQGALNEVVRPRPLRRASVEAAAAGHSGAQRYTAEDLLDKVEELCSTGEFELTVSFCDKALEMMPESARALEYKAIALQELGRMDEAGEALQQAISIEPDTGPTKFMYLGQLTGGEDAVAAFTEAIRIMVGHLETLSSDGAAAAVEEAPDVDERAALVRDISSAFCSVAEIYLTDLCDDEGAEQACLDCLERALQYNPQCPQAMQTMASVSLSLQQPDSAMDWMQQSMALWHNGAPGEAGGAEVDSGANQEVSYDFRINSAKILLELNQHDIAAEVLEQLLLEDAEVVEVWYLLGLAQKFGDAADTLSTLCRTKLLYALTESTQEGILTHVDSLLEEYPPDDVGENMEFVARTLGPAAEAMVAGES